MVRFGVNFGKKNEVYYNRVQSCRYSGVLWREASFGAESIYFVLQIDRIGVNNEINYSALEYLSSPTLQTNYLQLSIPTNSSVWNEFFK